MLQDAPDPLIAFRSVVTGVTGLVPVAMLARLLQRHQEAQMDRRKFWSTELWWEFPTAILSAIIGYGIALFLRQYMPISVATSPDEFNVVSNAIVGVCSWVGPKGMTAMIWRLVSAYSPKKGGGHER
jgi:hypothetical protein